MGETTAIAWTDATFNPWIGCTKVAPGCAKCYAEELMDKRYGRVQWGPNGTRSRTSDGNWGKPKQWNAKAKKEGKRLKVFCASLADVFEDWGGPILDHEGRQMYVADVERDRYVSMPDGGRDAMMPMELANLDNGTYRPVTMNDLREDLFKLWDATPWLDWLVLTKRPENIRRMYLIHCLEKVKGHVSQNEGDGKFINRRQNVWLGTSVSEQETADVGIPELMKCGDLSMVLWISYEPALGPIDFSKFLGNRYGGGRKPDWVIVGGESGHTARMFDLDWGREVVRQCNEAGVPVFVKQMGSFPVEHVDNQVAPVPVSVPVYFNDNKGTDPSEWPGELRVRQFPEAFAVPGG